MKIPIRYNPLGNDYQTSGGAIYGSKGCFLFRDSLCVQSNMTMTSKDIGSGTGKINRLEMYDSGLCSAATLMGGKMYVYGGTATATEVYAGGTVLVESGGVADGVNIPASAYVTAGSEGTVRNAYLYQASARLYGYKGTIADTTLGTARCSITVSSCLLSNITQRASTYVSVNVGTVSDLSLIEPAASFAMVSAHADGVQVSKGSAYFDRCTVSDFTLGSDAMLAYASGITMTGLTLEYGARLSVTLNDSYDTRIQGTCPYGSMMVTSGLISGGLYHQLSVSNGAAVSDAHIYTTGSFYAINKTKVNGLTIHGSGSGSNFIASAYTTVGGVAIMDNGARVSSFMNARSTMSNVRFSNTSGMAYLSCLGDGAYMDISAGSMAYVYASLSNGGVLSDISCVSASLTGGLYGLTENVEIEKGGVLISRYGTASHVHVASGGIELTEAVFEDVTVTSSGTLNLNACAVTGAISGGGSLCRATLSSNCTLSSASFGAWGSVNLYNATGSEIQLGAGSYYGGTCTLVSVQLAENATARFAAGTHEAIVVSSGAVYELTSSAYASTVHVLAGGSLNCINNAECWACTSDTGAIVTGSNIHYV